MEKVWSVNFSCTSAGATRQPVIYVQDGRGVAIPRITGLRYQRAYCTYSPGNLNPVLLDQKDGPEL